MWISGTSQYAIRAVVYVATHGADAPVTVGPIADALDVPRNYLSKTLYELARAGVLHSARGRGGGFRLAIPPSRLTLDRVTGPFEDVATRQCLLGKATCGDKHPCAAHAHWVRMSDALQTFFRRTTIADLIAGAEAVPTNAAHAVLSQPEKPAGRRRARAPR
jgi:Rrf2 family protein